MTRFRKPAIIFLIAFYVGVGIAMFARPLDKCEAMNCANICRGWKIAYNITLFLNSSYEDFLRNIAIELIINIICLMKS